MSIRAREQRIQWLRNGVFLLALTTASQGYSTETQAEAPAEPATPPLEQPAEASADAAPESEAGDTATGETPAPTEPAETTETEVPAETGDPAEPDAPAEEPVPEVSENDADPSATEPTTGSNRYYLFAGIAILLVILVVLIRLVGRNRRQSRAPLATAAAAAEEAGPAPFGYFHIRGAGQPRIYNLSADVTNVGRSTNNDLVLANDTVSSSHLVVKRERNGCVLVTDLNSSNGTRINGEDVSQAKLVPGDELELGDVVIRFETRAPASAGDMTRQPG